MLPGLESKCSNARRAVVGVAQRRWRGRRRAATARAAATAISAVAAIARRIHRRIILDQWGQRGQIRADYRRAARHMMTRQWVWEKRIVAHKASKGRMTAHNVISERVIQLAAQTIHVQIELLIGLMLLLLLLLIVELMLTRHVCMMMLKLVAALSRPAVLIGEWVRQHEAARAWRRARGRWYVRRGRVGDRWAALIVVLTRVDSCLGHGSIP